MSFNKNDRFRKLGSIDYNERIQAYKSLLGIVLHDQLPGDMTEEASILSSIMNPSNTRVETCAPID